MVPQILSGVTAEHHWLLPPTPKNRLQGKNSTAGNSLPGIQGGQVWFLALNIVSWIHQKWFLNTKSGTEYGGKYKPLIYKTKKITDLKLPVTYIGYICIGTQKLSGTVHKRQITWLPSIAYKIKQDAKRHEWEGNFFLCFEIWNRI